MDKNKIVVGGIIVFIIIAVFIWWPGRVGIDDGSQNKDLLENSKDNGDLSFETLPDIKNQEYTIDERKIKLQNGEAKTALVGGSSALGETKVLDGPAYADIDGDNYKDAVVILRDEPGGSGLFYHVAAVVTDSGNTHATNSVFLGDRIRIKSISIGRDDITIVTLTRMPNEPFATMPTVEKVVTLKYEGGLLVEKTESL